MDPCIGLTMGSTMGYLPQAMGTPTLLPLGLMLNGQRPAMKCMMFDVPNLDVCCSCCWWCSNWRKRPRHVVLPSHHPLVQVVVMVRVRMRTMIPLRSRRSWKGLC